MRVHHLQTLARKVENNIKMSRQWLFRKFVVYIHDQERSQEICLGRSSLIKLENQINNDIILTTTFNQKINVYNYITKVEH